MSGDSTPAPVIHKDVPDFPGYRVGDDGSVWTCKTRVGFGKWGHSDEWIRLQPITASTGYLVVSLFRGGRCYQRSVHALVLEVFVGPCPLGMEACHDPDPTRTNCRLENLRWDTRKRNHADKKKHGTWQSGEKANNVKLNNKQVAEIRNITGMSQRAIATKYGVSQATVYRILKRIAWQHI